VRVTDVAAPPGEAEATPRRRSLRARPAPWTGLVIGSVVLLLAATVLLAAAWSTTRTTNSTAFTAIVPGNLLRVEIQVAEGDIEILGGATPDLLVNRTDSSVFGHSPEERRTIADGVLRIESSCPQLVVGSCAADYQLTVPESVSLVIVAEHGDVRLTAYRGSVRLSTLDGDLTVEAFCGSLLDATARGGGIAVTATCPPGRMTLLTTTGDVDARVPPGRYSVDVKTISGRATILGVADEPDAARRIQVLSNSGDVTVAVG
jgi:DUF4097 and DUF4098 domain-containing protein YvlB